MKFRRILACFAMTCSTVAAAQANDSKSVWSDNYAAAYQSAKQQQRYLWIHFDADTAADIEFKTESARDEDVLRLSAEMEKVRVAVLADSDGASLLDHEAFRHLRGNPGLVIVDLKNIDTPYYGRPVSCLPFVPPSYYAPPAWGLESTMTLLQLPPGSITQRTMIYAIRTHPEDPRSTDGHAHDVLVEATTNHATHQARIRRQGHHNWGFRFQRLRERLSGKAPVEVCAESWPNENLVDACFSCVHAWRQSSGHWSAVRASHAAFGYDIRRGDNGIWYAAGIFGGSSR